MTSGNLLRRVADPDLVKAERPCVGGLSSEHKWWLLGAALHLNSAFLFFRSSITHVLLPFISPPPPSPQSYCESAAARHAFFRYSHPCTGPPPLLPHGRLGLRQTLLQSHDLFSIACKLSTRRSWTTCHLPATILLLCEGTIKVSSSTIVLFARATAISFSRADRPC